MSESTHLYAENLRLKGEIQALKMERNTVAARTRAEFLERELQLMRDVERLRAEKEQLETERRKAQDYLERTCSERDKLAADVERLTKAHDHQYNVAGLMLREAEHSAREVERLTAQLRKVLDVDAADLEAVTDAEVSKQTYRGNSVEYWYNKAKCYSELVHGIGPKLRRTEDETLSAAADRFIAESASEAVQLKLQISNLVFDLRTVLTILEDIVGSPVYKLPEDLRNRVRAALFNIHLPKPEE